MGEKNNVIQFRSATGSKVGEEEITIEQLRKWDEMLYAEALHDAEGWLEEFGEPFYMACENNEAADKATSSYFQAACERAGLRPYLEINIGESKVYTVREWLAETYCEDLNEHTCTFNESDEEVRPYWAFLIVEIIKRLY